MDVISFLIGLMLLLCSISRSTTSPSEFYSRAKLCPDRSICNCVFVQNDYEIECPSFDPNVIVKVKPTTYVQIECLTLNETVYKQLAPMEVGDIPRVQFSRCPLPMGGSSLMTILNRLGIRKTRSLMFLTYGADLGSSLVRQHLSGFTDLEQLRLSGNGLSELPEDLFNDVVNITWLDLRSNKVHLPVNIFRSLKKLEYLELGYNNLKTLEPGVFKYQQKLKNLNLWGNNLQHLRKEAFEGVSSLLELDMSSNNIETLQPDVFSYLTNLTTINLSANKFRKLPDGLFENNKNLVQLRMIENRVDLDTLPNGFLSGLLLLEEVNVKCGLNTVPGDLFSGSTKIKTLSLAGNKLVSLPVELFANQSNMLDLDLSGNGIIELEDGLFDSMSALSVLKLSHNNLTMISGILFHGLSSVREIHLDHNQLKTIHHLAFTTTTQIRNLQLQDNHLSFLNEDEDGTKSLDLHIGSPFQYLEDLQILNLRNNEVITILSDWIVVNNNLKELDLSYNNLTSLTFEGLQFFSEGAVINLTYNAIRDVNFRDYEAILRQNATKSSTVWLNYNPLTCDCRMFHFIQYIHLKGRQQISIEADQLKCASPLSMYGKSVTDLQLQDIVCPLDPANSSIKHCPSQCDCFVRPYDRVMGVNCSNANLKSVPILPDARTLGLLFTELYLENNNLTELPDLPREGYSGYSGYSSVSVIRARNNSIRVIREENIPPKLRIFDVSYNRIDWLNDTVFAKLNKTSELQDIVIGQNPWTCDCTAKTLSEFVKLNTIKIKDLKYVTCDGGELLIQVANICSEAETIIVALSVVLALLGLFIGILAALYYKYQQEIKVWMYAHNWCSWFVTEDELDKDKKYDAFISYSHKDVDFVTEQIVPELENGVPSFKLCLHERDWVAGEFITESIARSVEDSRRTIVILTPNFLESIWGKMEFQVAHKNAITEGRVRVIVVIYGDIGDIENLDPALKLYLKTNTYIKWGDPWFWEKLRYAMPHANGYKSKGLVKSTLKSSVDDKLELIKPVPVTPPLTTPPAELAGQKFANGLNGHVNGAFIINTNAKQSDV